MPNDLSTVFPRARRSRALVSIPLALTVLVACTTAPPVTTPGATPSQTPTASPATPLSTQAPSPTAAPPTAPPPTGTPAPGEIGHPTGATDIVLRMEQGGGMMIPNFVATDAPPFTLYGDGTFILRQQEDPERTDFAQGMPRFLHGRMTEEYVQALLRFALGPGRLLDARAQYLQNMCADCGSTTFTLNAAGLSKTVVVDALGMVEEQGPDAADRRGFAELRETIAGLEARAKSGELGEVVLYDPDVYRVVLFDSFGEPVVEPLEWPWPDISVDDFQGELDSMWAIREMNRDEVALLVELPTGGHPGVWVEDPEANAREVGVRPLLPDEIATDLPTGG